MGDAYRERIPGHGVLRVLGRHCVYAAACYLAPRRLAGVVGAMTRVRESCERLMDAAQARYGALIVQGEECVLVLREDLELLLATWSEKHDQG